MANRRSKALLARCRTAPGRAVSALTAFFFLVSSGAGLFSGTAQAGDLPRVLVLPYAPIYQSLPASAGEKTAEFLNTELRGSEQVQLVTLDEKALTPPSRPVSPGPARDEARLIEAEQRAGKAEELIKTLKFKQAAEELEKVIALYEGQHPYVDFSELVEAYLDLAVARFRLGQDEEGESLFAQVVRLDPERKLEAGKFPPVFVRVFESTAKRVKGAPRAAIRVETAVQGATVLLDGREVGKAPLMIKDVIKGAHYLRVVPPGGEAWADRIDAAAGDVVRVAPNLGAAGGPIGQLVALLSRNVIDEAAVETAAGLAEKAGAEYAVIGGVHKEAAQLVVSSHLVRASTRKVCLLQRVVFDEAMLGAGIEIYKVGADVANKVEIFGEPETLPAKVARDALGSAAVAEVTSTGDKVDPQLAGRPAIVRRDGEGTTTVAVDTPRNTKVRKLTASGEPDLFGEPDDPIERRDAVGGGGPTWLWIALGVAVVGGAAGGGYFYYSQATQPITGAGPVSW